MNNALPEGYVAHMPARPPLRHALGEAKTILACVSPSGHEHVEKTCGNCGVTRITVIGGAIPRMWRLPNRALVLVAPPCEALPCVPKGKEMVA